MKFSEPIVRKAAASCAEFCCGECPYDIYTSKDYPLRCIHYLMADIDELLNGKEENKNV